MPNAASPLGRGEDETDRVETEPLLANEVTQPGQADHAATPAAASLRNHLGRKAGNKGHGIAGTELALRIATAMFAFMVMGMIQSTVGVRELVPVSLFQAPY